MEPYLRFLTEVQLAQAVAFRGEVTLLTGSLKTAVGVQTHRAGVNTSSTDTSIKSKIHLVQVPDLGICC